MLVLILCDLIILRNSLVKASDYNGINFIAFTGIVYMYGGLLFLSKKGYIRTASYILIASYWAGALHCGYKWGASLPVTLVTFIFIIFISSILINSKFGIKVTAITIVSFLLLGIHEYRNPEILSWRMDAINNTDLIVYSLFLIGVALLSWLSNKETEKSLERARKSEKELKNERDSLEIKVIERTKELKESQLTRMNELAGVAEFGRLSQGLFHDLLSPLTAMVLHMEKIKGIPPEEMHRSHASMDKIVLVSKRMNETIHKLRSSLRTTMPKRVCMIQDEINNCIDLLRFKITENNIDLNIVSNQNCQWYGDPMKLQQIFLNVISNAIDACALIRNRDRKIMIRVIRYDRKCKITIEDNGIGISKDELGKIFDPFFTTKTPEKGTGIGLTTVQKIIKEIRGTILVTSVENSGSAFTILFPLK